MREELQEWKMTSNNAFERTENHCGCGWCLRAAAQLGRYAAGEARRTLEGGVSCF